MDEKNKLREILATPHFHYDVEWWKTESGYNRDVEEILLKALEMLGKYPEFTYVIDQALALKPFWDKYPERRDEIRGFVAAGRVELVGGTWCAPDENIPRGEAFIRQFVYGLRFLEDEVGGRVTTAWEIDEFGHPAQIPQLLARCGLRHFVFARGVQDWAGEHPGDFLWEAPDGSRALTHWFAGHYTGLAFMNPFFKAVGFSRRELLTRIDHEARRSPADVLMVPFGTDFSVPTPDWLDFAREWNESGETPIRFALPRDFFAALEGVEAELPVVRGELNPLLTGCYESREKVKENCRRLGAAIVRAELWSTVAWLLGGREYPKRGLDRAWELLLENDFHDIVCGTGTDKVYRATLKRYAEAEELIGDAESGAVESIVENIDTSGQGAPLVVFNALNFERTDVARVALAELGGRAGGGFTVRGPDGAEAPCQVEGGDLLFMARVPAGGYSVYHVTAGGGGAPFGGFDGTALDTPFYRVEMDAARGGIGRLFDKENGREALDCTRWAGGEIFVEEDAGNLWTVQKTGRTWRTQRASVRVRPLPGGPVRCGFEVKGRNNGLTFMQRVYFYKDIRRIDFDTWIDFNARDRRVKAMFEPAGGGEVVFETPFYAQPRGDGHWCAQNWVDSGGPDGGAAVLNTGSPGHDVDGAAIGLVLFRSVSMFSPAFVRFFIKNLPDIARKLATVYGKTLQGFNNGEWFLYDYHGIMLREWSGAGGMELPGGFNALDHLIPWLTFNRKADAWEQGRHRFRFSLLPHAGGWAGAGVTEAGHEVNNPLLAALAGAHAGSLAPSMSFAEVEGGGVIVSALKRAENGDGVVARVYESRGAATPFRLKMFREVKSAERVDFVEKESLGAAEIEAGAVTGELKPWEVTALRVRI